MSSLCRSHGKRVDDKLGEGGLGGDHLSGGLVASPFPGTDDLILLGQSK